VALIVMGEDRNMSEGRNKRDRWLYRQFRGARPDRNPLRRRIDRVESYLLAGLFAAAAAGAPFAVHAASQAAYTAALHTQQQQIATRHLVKAHLTEAAGTAGGYALSTDVPANAVWATPSGVKVSGTVPAVQGSPKGTPVTVWIDASGNLTTPPMLTAQVAGQADAAMAGTIAGIAITYLAGAGIIRQVANRRRLAAWDADWVVTAQTWNRQSW
jgi:hypothetical protein